MKQSKMLATCFIVALIGFTIGMYSRVNNRAYIPAQTAGSTGIRQNVGYFLRWKLEDGSYMKVYCTNPQGSEDCAPSDVIAHNNEWQHITTVGEVTDYYQ